VSLALVIVVVPRCSSASTDGARQRVFEAQQLFDMPDMYAAIFAAARWLWPEPAVSNHRAPLRSLGGQVGHAALRQIGRDRCFRRKRSSQYSYGNPFSTSLFP